MVCAPLSNRRVEKFRPSSLDDIHGQDEIVTTVRKFVHEGKLPHLLFYGPPGTGKTSTITAIAREIYGPHYKNMVLELNASDDRGIDVVRNQVKDFASTMQIFSRGFKLIILDEADAMTAVAQNSLRRIIEKYTKNTRFCILANYAHKLNPALVSRCTRFRFQPISEQAIRSCVDEVVAKENLHILEEAKSALLKLAKGDMRRALNVLQSCKLALDSDADEVDVDMIYDCVGAPHPQDVNAVLDLVLKDDWTTSYLTFERYKRTKGLALVDLILGFVEVLGDYEMKTEARVALLSGLADVEYGVLKGGTDKIQTSAVIGVVKLAMEMA